MKRLIRLFYSLMLLAAMLATPVLLLAQETEPVEEKTNWVVIIIGAVVAVIEIIARAVPGNFTGILGLIVDLLKRISDYLNNKGSS